MLRYRESNGLARYTEHTVQSVDDRMPQLELIRSTGVAVEIEEVAQGTACMAGAVTDAQGRLRATVAISSSIEQFHRKYTRLENAIRQATRQCGALLRAAEPAPR